MKGVLSLLLLIPCMVFATPEPLAISQLRFANETQYDALNRMKQFIPDTLWARESPLNQKASLAAIDFSLVPQVTTYEELMHMFYTVRDTRFLYEKELPDFGRRISWLYPDDGCFFRAEMTGIKLEKEQLIRPVKIFVFGDLMITTAYSSVGVVYWWYHVAAIVNYMGSMYVIDPALNAMSPMLVDEWFSAMGNSNDLTGIICNEYTYDPVDYCFKATAKSDVFVVRDQASFLKKEWNRMTKLGFRPEHILGENPPWNYQ